MEPTAASGVFKVALIAWEGTLGHRDGISPVQQGGSEAPGAGSGAWGGAMGTLQPR